MIFGWSVRWRFGRTTRMLAEHFGKANLAALVIRERQFPVRVRADLQRALETCFADPRIIRRFCGVRQDLAFNGISLTEMIAGGWMRAPIAAPPEYEEIDIGEQQPVRCVKVGLWLIDQAGCRYASMISRVGHEPMITGIRVQIAITGDERSTAIAEEFFNNLERAIREARSYRGKVLSLETGNQYTGQSTGIKVNRLRTVSREQVILPAKTLALLDRNIIQFVQRRGKLAERGQATKKGILFYGPPGTGKSHTIHYLAAALTGHTTLLITAEQVGLLDEYMTLARLLQPSVVVIEDVDLIARDRSEMRNPCEEVLLNKLLNEMDGLKESADILFILTTNRPQALEAALASRPGRVDQAIEFPLPDEAGREKLVRLYGKGIDLSDDLVRQIVARTDKVSAAFIKELIRRSVQFQLERDGAQRLEPGDVDQALDEMLFSGGSLNVALLGGNANVLST